MVRFLVTLCGFTVGLGAAESVSEEVFKTFDRDGDGVVTAQELPRAAVFARYDTDGDGMIRRDEVGLPPPLAKGPIRVPPARIPVDEALLVGHLVPDLRGVDATGTPVRLRDLARAQVVTVLAVRDPDCPVGARLRPDLVEVEGRINAAKGVMLRLGLADDAQALADDDRDFIGPRIDDPMLSWCKALGIERTTEVLVLDRSATVRYRGAINDRVGIGYVLEAARATYLLDAVVAVISDHPVVIPATSAPGCALDLPSTVVPPPDAPTWHGEVSRIFQQRCLSCHTSEGIAPFPLESLAQVTGRRLGMVKEVVTEGRMPPWFAAPDVGRWSNDAGLGLQERATLAAWFAAGCPPGDPSQAPPPLIRDGEWTIGTPDLVLELPSTQSVPATGVLPYRRVTIPNPLDHDVWIQAYEIRPTAPQVVHHVLAFLAGEERETGGGVRSFFAGMVPGQNAVSWAPGLAKRLPAGHALNLQIHYTTNGEAAKDRTRIAFRFASEPPEREVFIRSAATVRFQIPPGAPDHVVRAQYHFDRDTVILAFMPHMHVRGKAFRYELRRPGQESEILLDIPRYDFNWQLRYDCSAPISVPAGSVLAATAHYDNSPGNPANPDPQATVTHGEQTWEEMMIGYFEYYEP